VYFLLTAQAIKNLFMVQLVIMPALFGLFASSEVINKLIGD